MKNIFEPQKRLAAINDISGLGKCSLTVALPVVSATGVECACLPTALLSTHTGEFSGFTRLDLSGELLPIAEHWRSVGVRFDAVYSGYLASPEQALLVERVIDTIADGDTLVIVDPAMADNGEYYSGFDSRMCAAFASLCGRASVITPNVTEAALLAGLPLHPAPHGREYIDGLMTALSALCQGVIAITGVRPAEGAIGYVVRDRAGNRLEAMGQAYDGTFYGTGDIFASSFAALLTRGASVSDALSAAASLVEDSVHRTLLRDTPRRFGVDFESALPAYLANVSRIFSRDI
ncbi:MAG: pyridoxamine kinase [Oscillospiraceae bacterium]